MRIISLSMLLFLVVTFSFAQEQKRPDPQPAPEIGETFRLGMAGYTFAKFDLQTTLETLQRCDVHYLCIKDFHLPIESTTPNVRNTG